MHLYVRDLPTPRSRDSVEGNSGAAPLCPGRGRRSLDSTPTGFPSRTSFRRTEQFLGVIKGTRGTLPVRSPLYSGACVCESFSSQEEKNTRRQVHGTVDSWGRYGGGTEEGVTKTDHRQNDRKLVWFGTRRRSQYGRHVRTTTQVDGRAGGESKVALTEPSRSSESALQWRSHCRRVGWGWVLEKRDTGEGGGTT